MNKAILSTKYPQFAASLQKLGYDIIPSEEIPCHMEYERDHADLQCLILNDTAFVLSYCRRLSEALSDEYRIIQCGERFNGKYPDNICLSAILCDHQLICREPSLDNEIKRYCHDNRYELINVKQGYTKCSCAQIADNAIITSDNGIIKAIKGRDIDVLPIGQGSIRLDGARNGFIGGASGYDPDRKTIYFCGNIDNHPNSYSIKNFCEKHGTTIISLTDDDLTDIGGVIFC